MSVNKTNKGNEFSSWVTETNTNSETTLTHISQNSAISIEASTLAIFELEAEQVNSHSKNVNQKDELIVETKSIFQRLKAKTAAALVGSAVMLPILAVGTATYYFGSQAINKQTILAKRANIDLAETELGRQQKLLAVLLIGTGTTALLAGAVAALGTNRLWNASKRSREETAAEAEARLYRDSIDNLSQSDSQKDIVKAIVEEARTYLNCDRVIVYSLNRDKQGVIVAESVVAGYPQALGKTIKDPFEARDLHKYRDRRVKAINDLNQVEMTFDHQEQLEDLEVKANLVTPIINDGKLFGLLAAHQCSQPRHWQQEELEFLYQLAKKAALALENAQLLDDLVRFQTQAERERKWTHYFNDAIQYIRQSIKQEDILEISVEEVRKVLNCDRVIVYSLNQDNYGVVVAESVTAGYPRALNQTIADPCFEARYLDKYRDGRVSAINDIYAARMAQCYIEKLEELEVKANLVTPILNQGKLFGLLVAHQCSQPRHWQDYEIRWVTQIATQVGFALDNAQVLAASTTIQIQAERERKWTHYFSDAIQYIRQSIKQEDILKISVEEVRKVLNCDRVIVYSLNQDNYGVVVAESVTAGYPRALNQTIADPCFEARYLDKYRDGRVSAINDIYAARMTQCYIEQLEELEVKANLVTPILNQGKLFGLLVTHQCSQPRDWQDYEIRWVTQIATQVGFALDNATLLRKFKNDALPTQLLNNFSLGISPRVNQSKLLEIAVEQVRQVIQLDRVMVYQFEANAHGNIAAEAVAPGYPRALNCHYEEKYHNARIEAIANIDRANLTSDRLEQLETLAVKASLTVPILQDEQLFGLLIGHQCQQSYLWSQSEIDLFAQLALQLGFAIERVKLREELALAQDSRSNEVDKQQLEQTSLNQRVWQVIRENQATLPSLKAAKGDFLNQGSEIINSDLARQQLNDGEIILQPKNIQLEDNLISTKLAIAEATDKVEVLKQSHQNLDEMVNLINDLKKEIDRPVSQTKPVQLPTGEIIVETSERLSRSRLTGFYRPDQQARPAEAGLRSVRATHQLAWLEDTTTESTLTVGEITLNPVNKHISELDFIKGQLVEKSQSAPSLILINQFVGEITNLSEQISQQSLVVTESFQKLATFAKQLSDREKL
ncbi:MAG TPA: GAF domain-containing protein [Coleofasciculaceae cyanobacterium]|jgi:methyl-accepting chemotaxis protein PixJ